MRIFKKFFFELNQYLKEWINVDREEWLIRISAWVTIIITVLLLLFFWKKIRDNYLIEYSKDVQRFIRYFLVALLYLTLYFPIFQFLKFLFLKRNKVQNYRILLGEAFSYIPIPYPICKGDYCIYKIKNVFCDIGNVQL